MMVHLQKEVLLFLVVIRIKGWNVKTIEEDTAETLNDLNLLKQWKTFMEENGKSYNNAKEYNKRFNIFTENYLAVMQHNREYVEGQHSYMMKIHPYSDMTFDEQLERMTGILHEGDGDDEYLPFEFVSETKLVTNTFGNLSDEVDWREEGAVTNVKKQGLCGACWAFSVTGTLEGQYFLGTGNLTTLSEQNLIDCSDNNGCKGGNPPTAFDYIEENDGLYTEEDYPYKHKNQKCKNATGEKVAAITGFVKLPPKDEEALREAVATIGPISVCIHITYSLINYKQGVYHNSKCGEKPCNHAVLAVGYGVDEDSGLEYWLVKNSWGAKWGDHGYIKIQRNKENMCRIASASYYPLL